MSILWRGSWVQRLRLASGLVLFAYVITHFLNHAVGLISLDAMIAVDHWRVAVTRSAPGTLVLAGALVIHVALAIWRIAGMRSWRLPRWQLAQIAFGFATPFLLLPHIVGTRITASMFGIDTSYPYELARIWPATMLDQTVLLLIVWVHACIGLHFWLRLAPGYDRLRPLLFSLVLLIPFAALAGVMMQARALTGDLAGPIQSEALRDEMRPPPLVAQEQIVRWRDEARLAFYVPLAGLLLLIGGTAWWRRRAGGVSITYLDGPTVRVPAGATLLEVSRSLGIPHASVCGGRARCSTCRVRVIAHSLPLPPLGEAEARTLRAIGATADIRLACQWRPAGEVMVARLVQPLAGASSGSEREADDQGVDTEAAVLFVDIRGFTALSERKLAYDIVHILNRFFAAANLAVQEAGGRIDKYIGDGLMAIFVDPRGIDHSCRSAIAAASAIGRELATVNRDLSAELKDPLRIAMGLHGGRLVGGRIGAGRAATRTVIGPAVNVASRLEAVAKARGAELALSRAAAEWAALDITPYKVEKEEMRGLDHPIEVVLIERLAALDAMSVEAVPG
ncbi:MAG: 2Fe-2S iron-sulfur cluster binding domain-containing protein [Hyphomicrobiales bacterium]|nr:2Fe-2S iron-sulfur cluster binding domain-containing protein [Hyphomicrobiales bacterium]